MKNMNKIILIIILLILVGVLLFLGFSNSKGNGISYNETALSEKLTIDMNNWNYDEDNDIYYQIGLVYCLNPENTEYESCAIYVPGKYFTSTKNSNGTYNCTLNTQNNIGNYTANSAPIVMPINTPGYSECKAPSLYNSNEIKEYINAGFIYLNSGCRGRNNAEAPDGVVDLKSAVLYYRFNNDLLPGDTEKIFTFGHSGGGAQSALMGTTGNSKLYTPYLESIGAPLVDKTGNTMSNAVTGSMCWCPITNLDTADEAYEWNMGQYTRTNGTFTYELSKDLATEYAKYINDLGLKDQSGNKLNLEESNTGIYTSGSYYDYILGVTEESLNNFLNDTTFPYTPNNNQERMPSGGMGEGIPSGEAPTNTGGPAPSGEAPNTNSGMPNTQSTSSSSLTTYETAQEYIDSLNTNDTWIEYDANTNTAKITSLEAFVKHCKNPSKSVCAFDDLNRSQAENALFGIDANSSAHFDKTLTNLLKNNTDKYSKYNDYNKQYATDYTADLEKKDKLNNTMETRVNMYNPMYYLCDYYDGEGTSEIAKYWRINTGIEQGDTSECVEINLYLALVEKVGTDNVEFNTVWSQGHTQAERTGNSTTNFINWVNTCLVS